MHVRDNSSPALNPPEPGFQPHLSYESDDALA